MKKLKMLIEPFILRRNKTDVLTELPEKTITVVNNQMEQEQEMIYLSYLSKIKKEVAEEINMNGFGMYEGYTHFANTIAVNIQNSTEKLDKIREIICDGAPIFNVPFFILFFANSCSSA